MLGKQNTLVSTRCNDGCMATDCPGANPTVAHNISNGDYRAFCFQADWNESGPQPFDFHNLVSRQGFVLVIDLSMQGTSLRRWD